MRRWWPLERGRTGLRRSRPVQDGADRSGTLALRVALLVGVADAAVALATALATRPQVASIAVGLAWLVAWSLAAFHAPRVGDAVRARPWLPALLGGAGLAVAALDGGYPGNLATQPGWLVLVAAAALPWRWTLATGVALLAAKSGLFAATGSGPPPLGDSTNPEARTATVLPLLLVPLGLTGAATIRRLQALRAAPRAAPAGWSPGPAAALEAPVAFREAAPAAAAAAGSLTPAEREIVTLLAAGRVPKEIAAARGTTLATVRTQIKHAKRRTGARTLDELVLRLDGEDRP